MQDSAFSNSGGKWSAYLLCDGKILKNEIRRACQTVGLACYSYFFLVNILFRSQLHSSGKIAGQHGHFTMEDYRKWLKKADIADLAPALRRLAQLSQSKVYLFWNFIRD